MMASATADALQCVPFAREISGISIRGDAWTWWSAAVGSYDRGQTPRLGAVVVFKKHGSMRHGHVAVVTGVVNSREVLVDHANWGSRRTGGRGQIAKGMSVVDISPRNDWSEVRVWNRRSGDYGTRVYPTYGFIYPQGSRTVAYQQAAFIPTPPVVVPPVQAKPTVVPAVEVAPIAAVQKLSRPGDQVLATADLQMAAALSESGARPAKIEVKALEVAVVEVKAAAMVKPAAPSAGADSSEDDQALAKRFGSGRY